MNRKRKGETYIRVYHWWGVHTPQMVRRFASGRCPSAFSSNACDYCPPSLSLFLLVSSFKNFLAVRSFSSYLQDIKFVFFSFKNGQKILYTSLQKDFLTFSHINIVVVFIFTLPVVFISIIFFFVFLLSFLTQFACFNPFLLFFLDSS